MNRLDAMADRLPAVYAIEPGTLLKRVLSVLAVELATFDEEMDRVQRSHWTRTAFTRADLERIAALVDVQATAWESEDFFRGRLLALTAARLAGAVTWRSIKGALLSVLESAVQGLGMRLFALREDDGTPRAFQGEHGVSDPLGPAFIEFPTQTRRSPELLERRGLVRTLDRLSAPNHGFRATWLSGIVRGLPNGVSCVPLLVNTRNGHAVGFAGRLRAGEELRFSPQADGTLRARLTGLGRDLDVSERLLSTRTFPLASEAARAPLGRDSVAQAIALEPGDNPLWFVAVGQFDQPAFDKVQFAWPSTAQGQGVWQDAAHAGPGFGDAVFQTEPAASLDLFWQERTPAAFRVELPTGAVLHDAGRSVDPDAELAQLMAVLDMTAAQLRAAGVQSRVVGRPLQSVQHMVDSCRIASVTLPAEPASAGQSAEIALNAVFSGESRHANRFA